MKDCEKIHQGTGLAVFLNLNMKDTLLLTVVSALMLSVIIMLSAMGANAETTLSSPAEFIREISLPGTDNHFLRPGRVLVDDSFGEIYIADPGHSRVVIFDRNGTFLYEFSTAEQCGSPSDLAVDSEGYIYVLGTTLQGKKIFLA